MNAPKREPSCGKHSLVDRTRTEFEQCYGRRLSDEDVFEIIHSLKSYSQVLLEIHAGERGEVNDER